MHSRPSHGGDPDGRGPSPMPLAGAFAEFLTSVRGAKPSPHTITAYESDLRLVAGLLASDPSTLTTADLTARKLRAAFAAYAYTHAKASVARAWSTWNRDVHPAGPG